jgi:phosphatidylinositol-3-phosphatase
MTRASLLSLSLVAGLLLACGSGDDGFTDSGLDGSVKDSPSGSDASPVDGASGDTGNTGDAQGCGTCPTGYTCKTANGLPVCRSSTSQIPLFSHVFVVLMENTSLKTLEAGINNNQAPNLATWQGKYATGSDYHGVAHPSLPNYIALTSGDTQGIGCDCGAAPGNGTCHPVVDVCIGTCSCNTNATGHIADQLEAAQKTWMDFGESMGTACNLVDSGNYAVRHNPFLYYNNVQTNTARCTTHVVDFSQFDPNNAPNFSFIAPNLVSDMHNPDPPDSTNIPNGDKWLGIHAGAILSSSGYKNGGLLVIVWDEDDGSGGLLGNTDDPIGIWVMSPYAKSGGYVSATHADHYSLLATFEDGLDLGRIGKASGAQPLTDYFPPN